MNRTLRKTRKPSNFFKINKLCRINKTVQSDSDPRLQFFQHKPIGSFPLLAKSRLRWFAPFRRCHLTRISPDLFGLDKPLHPRPPVLPRQMHVPPHRPQVRMTEDRCQRHHIAAGGFREPGRAARGPMFGEQCHPRGDKSRTA